MADDELLALADEVRRDVAHLAAEIGERKVPYPPGELAQAAEYLEAELAAAGFEVKRQQHRVSGSERYNVEVEVLGTTRPEEIVIVGAHVGTVLALARRITGRTTGRTLRYAAFATEKPPYFQTDEIGSRVYARRCRARGEDVVGMLSLEAIGYPYYHKPEDTIEQIDFEQVARLVRGFEDMIAVLARERGFGGQSDQ